MHAVRATNLHATTVVNALRVLNDERASPHKIEATLGMLGIDDVRRSFHAADRLRREAMAQGLSERASDLETSMRRIRARCLRLIAMRDALTAKLVSHADFTEANAPSTGKR